MFLLQQLKSRITTQNDSNQYLDCLIDQSFHGVNRIFVLAFTAVDNRIGNSRYYLPTTKVEDYIVMIDWKRPF